MRPRRPLTILLIPWEARVSQKARLPSFYAPAGGHPAPPVATPNPPVELERTQVRTKSEERVEVLDAED